MKSIFNAKSVFILLLSFNVYAGDGSPAEPVEQPIVGYGSNGLYTKSSASFRNPVKIRRQVHVYWPTGATPAPTIFFSHAYGANNPDAYLHLIDHLVSRGYAVVFPEYPTILSSASERYNILWTGFEEAVVRYPNRLATNKVGYIGHSYGGGATPRMALNGTNQGWGSEGKFMVTFAPWYSFDLTDDDLANFPSDMKFLSLIYIDDDVNDQRMAMDIFNHINIPETERDFVILFSDTNCGYTIAADHIVPSTGPAGGGVKDGYDYYGTWRYIDALAGYAWNGSLIGKNVALGNGSDAQRYLGKWSCDDTDAGHAEVTDRPIPTVPESFYRFPWTDPTNPRL